MKLRYVLRYSLMACLCGVVSLTAHAARLEKPYVVDVPVASQSPDERARASVEGLNQLLQRLTGQSLRDNAVIQSKLGTQPDRYVLQYSYQKGQETAAVLPASVFRLRLVFSQNAVTGLLQEAGVGGWPLDRPRVLLLLQDGAGSVVLSGSEAGQQWLALGQHMGIPLALPDNVPAEAVSTDLVTLASLASQYQADAVWAGSVSGDDMAGWQCQGAFLYEGERTSLDTQATQQSTVFAALLGDMAGRLSGHYRSKTSGGAGAATIKLHVAGVDSYAKYIRLQKMLREMDAVDALSVLYIEGTDAWFEVDVAGEAAFRELLSLSRLVMEDAAAMPPAQSQTTVNTPVPAMPVATPPAVSTPATAPVSTAPASAPAVPVWHYRWAA